MTISDSGRKLDIDSGDIFKLPSMEGEVIDYVSCLCFMVDFQVLNERIENIARQTQEMEGRNQSLQLTVDRLSLTLAKTEEEEANQKVGHNDVTLSLANQ